MRMAVSIFLLCTYPILVFAETLQFKDGRELEGSIIFIGKDYIVFKVSDPNFVINPNENSVKQVIDNQTIVFKLDYISIPEDFWGMAPEAERVETIQNALLIHSGFVSSSRGFGMVFSVTGFFSGTPKTALDEV